MKYLINLSRILQPLLQSATCSPPPVPSCPHGFQLVYLCSPRMKLLIPLFLTLDSWHLLFWSFSDKKKRFLSFNAHLPLRPWGQVQCCGWTCAWGLEKSTPAFKMGRKEDTGNYQSPLPPWKGDGVAHSGGHLYAHGWQEGAQEYQFITSLVSV